ncbi:MAG TPA: hypothetical protein VIS95_03455 [Solirubrobacterales bacterium]
MKLISKLAVAAVAALAITVAVGASSASAAKTALCTNPGFLSCAGSILPAGSYLSVGGQAFTLSNNLVRFKCFYSAFGNKTTVEAVEGPLPATTETVIDSCQAETAPNVPGKIVSCQTSSISRPAAALKVTGPYGVANISLGSAGEPLTLSFSCSNAETTVVCTFQASSSVPLKMKIGEGMTFAEEGSIAEVSLALVSSTGSWPCGAGDVKESKLNMKGQLGTESYLTYTY